MFYLVFESNLPITCLCSLIPPLLQFLLQELEEQMPRFLPTHFMPLAGTPHGRLGRETRLVAQVHPVAKPPRATLAGVAPMVSNDADQMHGQFHLPKDVFSIVVMAVPPPIIHHAVDLELQQIQQVIKVVILISGQKLEP